MASAAAHDASADLHDAAAVSSRAGGDHAGAWRHDGASRAERGLAQDQRDEAAVSAFGEAHDVAGMPTPVAVRLLVMLHEHTARAHERAAAAHRWAASLARNRGDGAAAEFHERLADADDALADSERRLADGLGATV
jgi:hypothetical protein